MSAPPVEAGEGEAPPPKTKKKQLIVIGGAAALVLAAGGGGAYVFLGGSGDAKGAEAAKAETAAHGGKDSGEHGGGGEGGEGEAFLDVPPIVVNLHSTDGATRYLKLHIALVPAPGASAEELKKRLPLMIDALQPFLRELRPEDLAGAAAVFRIKEQLLLRATDALGPDQIKDVLVQDLLQQ